jgi:hypothetical protein
MEHCELSSFIAEGRKQGDGSKYREHDPAISRDYVKGEQERRPTMNMGENEEILNRPSSCCCFDDSIPSLV